MGIPRECDQHEAYIGGRTTGHGRAFKAWHGSLIGVRLWNHHDSVPEVLQVRPADDQILRTWKREFVDASWTMDANAILPQCGSDLGLSHPEPVGGTTLGEAKDEPIVATAAVDWIEKIVRAIVITETEA
jgi:hypothetical protein